MSSFFIIGISIDIIVDGESDVVLSIKKDPDFCNSSLKKAWKNIKIAILETNYKQNGKF